MPADTLPKPAVWTIYVDMDGVVADFVSAVIALLYGEHAVVPILRGWIKGTYDMAVALGQPEDKIWTAVRNEGMSFWSELERYSWATALVNQLQDKGTVIFLSSPSRDSMSAAGKLQWITEHFRELNRSYVLTPKNYKWRLADEKSILIDDSQDNIDAWMEHGGIGILFPRPWNDAIEPDAAAMADYVVGKVIEAMTEAQS